MDNGWVLLHRQLFESSLWRQKPFGKGQAWIDLFANANHASGSFWIRSNEIRLERGQIGWSELTMTERWGWSRMKCRRFLNDLEVRHQIRQQKNHLTSIITILNYDTYQQADRRRDNRRDNRKTADETQTKNDKEELNNDNELNHPAEPDKTNELFKLFYDTINPNINYAHKGNRNDAKFLIDKYGLENTLKFAEYAIKVQGKPYAPTITTPSQLKNKLSELRIYGEKQKSINQPKKGLVL